MKYQVAYSVETPARLVQKIRNFASEKAAQRFALRLREKGIQVDDVLPFEPVRLFPKYGDWRSAEDRMAEARDKRAIEEARNR